MKIAVHKNVLMQEVQGESVLLSIDNGMYYGLNDVGTKAWKYLTDTGDVDDAVKGILTEYEVDESTLRADLNAFVQDLLRNELADVVEP